MRKTPKTFSIHGGWGDHIEWMSWNERTIHGHLPQRPKVGDLLTAQMQSGRTAVFRFTEVKLMSDPPDQFFGTVEDVAYADDEAGRAALAQEKPHGATD